MTVKKKVKLVNVKVTVYDLKSKKIVEVEASVSPIRGKIDKALEEYCSARAYKILEILEQEEIEKTYSMSLEDFINNAKEE